MDVHAGIVELCSPHTMLVNRHGQRFADETFFQGIVPELRYLDPKRHEYPNLPAFLIFDSQYLDQYSFANQPAGSHAPTSVPTATTLAGVAIVMARPFVGDPVPLGDYFRKGTPRLHLVGILGGMIWNLGMSLSIIASGAAGFAISYGLGQGATLVAALWGVFVWKEFETAPAGTSRLLAAMFAAFVIGLGLIVYARIA
jgi:hypothetical protein